MAIEVLPGDRAWAAYRRNRLARWPTREDPARLHPLAAPQAHRVFALSGQERIFCIGSCFAREIENALVTLGFDVLSILKGLPRSPNRSRPDRAMFNKYNVASILTELRWALGEGAPYRHDEVLLGAPGDLLLQDFQLAGADYAEEPGFAKAFREAFNGAFAAIRQADVVVLTLGLSEVWKDLRTGLYLNNAPSEHLVAAYPGRFELHVFDHALTLAMLEQIDRLLAAHLRPGYRLMITVSPVPLWSTFREQDVLVANSYSKAVLRAAVEPFCAVRDHASYFPSYEFALLSNPLTVWRRDDFRHVDPVFVDYIMASVLAQFGGSGGGSVQPEEAREAARAVLLRQAGFVAEAATLSGPPTLRAALAGWWADRRAAKARQRRQAVRGNPEVLGHLDRWDGSSLTGWAFVAARSDAAEVTVCVDGRPVATASADLERADVAAVHGEARRHCGFHVALDPGLLTGDVLSVQVGGQALKTLPLGATAAD